MIRSNWTRRMALLVGTVPLLLLAGCPGDQAAAPGRTAAQSTAPALSPSQTAPSPAPTEAQTAGSPAPSAKTQALIDRAQASYRSGVANYQANRLDAARLDFDTAVDLLLTSGLNLKTDPQLAEEFERLLNAVNSLEMAALKQGNGFSPKVEESPLDTVGDLTFAPNPELTAKLKSELQTNSDLPLVINDQVAGYIGAFANSTAFRAHMLRSLERSGRYRAIIQKALADQGMPQDLFYLAVAESGFQPQALNARSGAGGMWQFMPTGAYGLARNGYVDERFDPEKSSVAYARYMKGTYRQLGDWYLAMAGYNWGPGNVQRAVMKTGYADFWELYRRNVLPKETKEYVPKILAAIIMAKNPVKYGLDKVVPEAAVVYDTVPVDSSIDLRLVSDITGASLPEIVGLNPSLLRMTTPVDLPFDLHIPVGKHDVFLARLKMIPENKRTSWRFHTVRPSESIEGIAAALHARAAEISEVNGLKPGESIEEGDELVIPITVASVVPRTQRYTVRRGDTLVEVADRFNISVEELRRWNGSLGRSLRAGQTLNVVEPVRLGPSMKSRRLATRGRSSRGGASRRGRGGATTLRADARHGAKSGRSSRSTGAPTKHASAASRSGATRGGAAKPKSKHKAAR